MLWIRIQLSRKNRIWIRPSKKSDPILDPGTDPTSSNLNELLFQFTSFRRILCIDMLTIISSSFVNLFVKLNNFNRSLSFELPKINKKDHKLLPSFALIKTWNDISLDLRRKKSLNSFKKHFSSALFEKYDNICKVTQCYACRK